MSEHSLQLFNDTNGTNLNHTEMTFTMMLIMSLPSQVTSILGLAGNGYVIWFLCFIIQRNPFTVYILNLAVADFIVLLCVTVTFFCILINPSILSSVSNIEYVFFMQVLSTTGYNASLLILTVISLERCISVLYPLWYKCHRPAYLSTTVCVFTWTFCILIMLIYVLECDWYSLFGNSSECTAVVAFLLFWSFGIVSPILIISSLLLIIAVKRNSKKIQPMKVYRVIIINVIVFLVTTLVPNVAHLLFFFQTINFHLMTFLYIPGFFVCLNSSANPYIYFLVGRSRKTKTAGSIKGALQRVFRSNVEPACQEVSLNTRVTVAED